MMNKEKIQTLLDLFWNAETTVAQEAELRSYFKSEAVAEEFKYARSYFLQSDLNERSLDTHARIIGKLVDKYFEAETSIEEEALIRQYYAQEQIHSSLLPYKAIFSTFNELKAVTFNKDLRLDNVRTLKVDREVGKSSKIITIQWLRTVAALFFLALASMFVYKNLVQPAEKSVLVNNAGKAKYIEIDDPQQAYEETIKALAMVSRKYKKGETHLLEGMKTMNEANIMK